MLFKKQDLTFKSPWKKRTQESVLFLIAQLQLLISEYTILSLIKAFKEITFM